MCELNNRTKDEEEEHFVGDKERFYIIRLRQKGKNRIFTGSFYQELSYFMNAEIYERLSI